jgi:hypothetical protein
MSSQADPRAIHASIEATSRSKRIAATIAILALACLALIFVIRGPLHYLIDPTPESFGRFWPNRPWLLVHIIGGLAAILIGPFQLSNQIRRRFVNVHRGAGRSYVEWFDGAAGTPRSLRDCCQFANSHDGRISCWEIGSPSDPK